MDFTFTVNSSGGMTDSAYRQFAEWLLKHSDKRVILSLKEAPKPGRPNKRKYYFAVIVQNVCLALREAGNIMGEEETHIMLKEEVGKMRIKVFLPNGEMTTRLKSYRELTPREESDYLTACTVWALSMGIDIPPPTTEEL